MRNIARQFGRAALRSASHFIAKSAPQSRKWNRNSSVKREQNSTFLMLKNIFKNLLRMRFVWRLTNVSCVCVFVLLFLAVCLPRVKWVVTCEILSFASFFDRAPRAKNLKNFNPFALEPAQHTLMSKIMKERRKVGKRKTFIFSRLPLFVCPYTWKKTGRFGNCVCPFKWIQTNAVSWPAVSVALGWTHHVNGRNDLIGAYFHTLRRSGKTGMDG